MSKKVIAKLIVIAISAFSVYKLTKLLIDADEKLAEERAEKERELQEYKKDILQGLDYHNIAEKTLKNDKVDPDDRTYLYEVYKKKLDAIIFAKNKEAVDKAKKNFDEFTDIWLADYGDKTAEIIASYVRTQKQKLSEERIAAEARKHREAELEKYKLIANAVTKSIGSFVSCHQTT